jgi:hypothetical protein
MMNQNWKEEIAKAIAPQMLKGSKWGSGDARASKITNAEIVKQEAASCHWQTPDTWFRASETSKWMKPSGYVAKTESERIAEGDSYWITQEVLNNIWKY